ncbi:hypothetical protein HQ535_12640 [bacterium]|nr:hypothetical protein [bacterium]
MVSRTTAAIESLLRCQPRHLFASKRDVTSHALLELGVASEYQQRELMGSITSALQSSPASLRVVRYRIGSVEAHSVALADSYPDDESLCRALRTHVVPVRWRQRTAESRV